MIKNSYQAVYRPQSIDFGIIQSLEIGAMLKVYLVDPDGNFVTAKYELKKQENDLWLISSCILIKSSSEQI